jgi:hypothetical protein
VGWYVFAVVLLSVMFIGSAIRLARELRKRWGFTFSTPESRHEILMAGVTTVAPLFPLIAILAFR